MTRFSPRWGALLLVLAASVYLTASLASGHSAASHVPPELPGAKEAALAPHPALTLVVREQTRVSIVDVRSSAEFAAYHLPGSISAPGASPRQVLAAMGDRPLGLLIASSDDDAAALITEVRLREPTRQLHFVQGGMRAVYLAFELPVPLFSAAPPPHGYHAASRTVREWLASGQAQDSRRVLDAIAHLATVEYAPTELGAKRPNAKAVVKKKITGGCG